MQSALNFQLDVMCGVTFASRKVAWEIVKDCMLQEIVPVHSCSRSPLRGVCVCVLSLLTVILFLTEYGVKFQFSPLF